MKTRVLIAAMLITAGCGTDGQATHFDVQMLSVSGAVDGRTIDTSAAMRVTGERSGDLGTFFVDSPDLTMQLSACPLGTLETNPYGGGGGPVDPSGRPIPVPDDAGVAVDGTTPLGATLPSLDCPGRGLFLCATSACTEFQPQEVDLQIVEENGWRHLTADANGAGGAVTVDLRYREVH